MLSHLARLMRVRSEADLAPMGLRPRHLLALTLVNEDGGVSQQALGSMLSIDGRNVVGLLNELEDDGLVSRTRLAADRRRHRVELTALGRDKLAAAEAAVTEAEDTVLGALTAAQRGALYELLRKATADQALDHALTISDAAQPAPR